MWLFDLESLRVLDANRAALATYGLNREAFLASTVAELLGTPHFDADATQSIDVVYGRRDATTSAFTVTTHRLAATVPAVALCTVGDAAHTTSDERLRAVNEQIVLSALREQSAREEAERAVRAKDEFLAVISHELRTPLQAMMGWIHLLKRGRLKPDDVAHALDVIERNTHIQAQLVADLLDVSRAASGKLTLQSERIDVRGPLYAAVDAIAATAEHAGVRLDVKLPESAIVVAGDAIRLEQIFTNLLSNAVKFTPAGGGVQVDAGVDGDRAQIRVSDTGEGFKPAFLQAMFQPFSQEDASRIRLHGGLGLGLMIVQLLVEAHGGRVHAQSDGKGRGAAFFVDLPLAVAPGATGHEQVNASPAEASAATEERGRLAGVRALVVEDHADTREMLHTVLERSGANVQDAGSAREALALLNNSTVDVVISDLGMPDVDGYAFLRSLRQAEGPLHDVPVIALSAFAGESEIRRARAAGFDAYVAKPVDPRDLVSVVERTAGRAGT